MGLPPLKDPPENHFSKLVYRMCVFLGMFKKMGRTNDVVLGMNGVAMARHGLPMGGNEAYGLQGAF